MTRTNLLKATLTATVALLALPAIALAHVEVEPEAPVQRGGYATLVFSVPNERPTASTVSISVKLPDDPVIAFVQAAVPEGWTMATTRRNLAQPTEIAGTMVSSVVDVVTWTATTAPIKAEDMQKFSVEMGPFPLTGDEVGFPAVQRYDTGEEVRWIEPPLANGDEPELPLPTVKLVDGTGSIQAIPASLAASASDGSGTSTVTSSDIPTVTSTAVSSDVPVVISSSPVTVVAVGGTSPTPVTVPSASKKDNGGVSGVVILVVAVAAVGIAGLAALARRRRR